jgi:dTDP-4-dehydrorhamnose reductase
MSGDLTVLVMGASGMLGNAVLRFFAASPGFSTLGSVRSSSALHLLPNSLHGRVFCDVNVENADNLLQLFAQARPNIVINCIGVVKQLATSVDPLAAIPINSLLPHKLAHMCNIAGARLIHVSTDCVFDGAKGMYKESDLANAGDLYGRSKLLGEVTEPQAVTLRTSIIGSELRGAHGLVSWFLSQRQRVKGFTRAVFSGLPTVELARVMRDFVIPRPEMHGLYHVSSAPIDKYALLCLIARVYGISIDIVPDDVLVIDRSLDSSRFQLLTGYHAPNWPELVRMMHEFG